MGVLTYLTHIPLKGRGKGASAVSATFTREGGGGYTAIGSKVTLRARGGGVAFKLQEVIGCGNGSCRITGVLSGNAHTFKLTMNPL